MAVHLDDDVGRFARDARRDIGPGGLPKRNPIRPISTERVVPISITMVVPPRRSWQ
jgi:hypothetical protein